MASSERWYFKVEQIHRTPSIKCGYDHDKELSCRQQAANFIQDMGQRLQVNQLCINTAIVYMHRFYMFHSFQRFHRTSLASASLFLAAKVEEQPRKLEHVIRFAQICLHRDQMPFDVTSQAYMEQVQDLIMNENILLQTLGFDVAIDHPHTHIVRCCQLVRASKDLAQTSYFMASYSLHLTTMCLEYKPTVVACFCIHLACKWSNWEIPESSEGRPWFWYVDKLVTSELLESLTAEFLNLFEKCPSRLKKKIMALSSYSNIPSSISNAPQGPPTQIPMSQAEIDKKKECRIAVESHNPLNSVPLPIGPLGVAVAEANSLQGVQTHPFIHQNTIVARHNSCSENLMKKHHYEHAGSTQRTPIVGPPPPPLPLDQPYKKLHHPPHHQRESHSMGMQGGAKLPSCMFDVGVAPPPPHKAYPQDGSTHVNPPPAVHPAASRTTNHVPTAHRPPSRPHVRNGEAHYPDKKLPLEVKPVETKPTQVVAPSIQVAARIKPKTPPNQLSLEPVVLPVKMERSIFSPEEKACSPPPLPLAPTRVHEKPKICSPPTPVVVIKKESPPTEPPTLPQASGALPPQDTRPSTHPSLNTGDTASKERVTTGVPLPAPDTPSKSSHAKKKKKKHKEHKDKHKDKHKHKHRVKDPEPIVITIPKEKITISHPEGLKIKIAKEKISAPPAAKTGLKLKISKDKLKKRERGSGGEEDDVQQPSKQHRPNGTAVLQVTLSNTFSSVLGKSILSPIRTPNFSNKYDSSPQNSPSHIPKYSPTQSGDCKPPLCVKTPGHHDPVYSPRSSPTNPCLSPIAATPRYSSPPSRSLSTLGNSHSTLEGDPAVSPLRSKPFLSPIAATPRHTSSTKQFKSPPQVETMRSQVTELSHMSPIQSKPFLSPIAATPRHTPKIKTFKSPPMIRGDISHPRDSEMPHMSPIRSKPFLSPLAPTPRHSSKTKTFKSPPTNHVYVPLAKSRSRPAELSHMSPVHNKPFLSPIAPTPRYPSPKQKSSPPPKHCYIPITETEESSASSVSPVSSTHSSLEHSDYEEESKVSSPVQFCSSPKMSGLERLLSPGFNSGCDQDYSEDKKLLSPIQTPAYVPETIKSPVYVPEQVYESPVGLEETRSPQYKDDRIHSPHHSSDKLGSPTSSSETIVSPEEHRYDSDSGSTSKTYSEKHSNYNSDKESMHDDNMMTDSCMDEFSNKYGSSPLETFSNSPTTSEPDKEQMVSCKSLSPDPKTDDVQVTPVYEEYRPYGKNIDCSSPLGTLENGGKCLLSPIMTPGRSPVRGESPEGKPTSPAIVPRYSPTDPNSLGCEPTGINDQGGRTTDRIREASPSSTQRRGPHTPPSPLQHYDPITPARPDPNEMIFKDSNDNHTERPSPGLLKKPYDRRCDEDKPYQRKHPLLPDFKIPRTTNRPRRHPGQDSIGPWPNRGRGRGGHFYPRSRGRGARFELPPPGQHHYRHPHRMPPHFEHDRGRPYFRRGQDMQRYEPAPPDHQVQRFDPSLVLQGNAYDAAIMKHAYETMGVPPEYFMHHYHQVYIPAYPPPPPLPEEPPPQPPPPPPPPH